MGSILEGPRRFTHASNVQHTRQIRRRTCPLLQACNYWPCAEAWVLSAQIAASLKDQQGGTDEAADYQTGDPRANWLGSDPAQGGKQNWAVKEPVPKPGDIRDPRAPDY